MGRWLNLWVRTLKISSSAGSPLLRGIDPPVERSFMKNTFPRRFQCLTRESHEKDLYFKERGLGLRWWPRWLSCRILEPFFWGGINEVHFSPIMLRQAASIIGGKLWGKLCVRSFQKGIVFPNGKGVSLPHFTAMWLPTYRFRLLTHIQKNGGLSSFSHSHCSVENGGIFERLLLEIHRFSWIC